MSEILGRKAILKMGAPMTAVASVRTKGFTVDNATVDLTNDSDNGIQVLAAEAGQKSVSMSVDGLFNTTELRLMDLALSATPQAAFELDFGTFSINGTFSLTNFTTNGTYNDATTFSASLSSSGAVVKV